MVEHHTLIQLTDERDRILRGGTMDEAQEHGYWHRVARVMVYDPELRLYLLQQVPENPHYDGGLWNTTASGHVDVGETYLNAALRELKEEMGISGLHLQMTDRYKSNELRGDKIFNRHNMTFVALADRATLHVAPAEDEVADTMWLDVVRLRQMVLETPQVATAGLARFAAMHHQRIGLGGPEAEG